MPPETEIEGQESASPTDVTKTGQEQLETAPPADDSTEAIIKAASDAEASAASEEAEEAAKVAAAAGEEKKPEEKAAPYDQDPKWLAARAAEKNFNAILEEYGVDGADGLKAMLDSGMQLQEILGDRDAKILIQDAATLKKYEDHWAKQERIKKEEALDPDERADLYKKELDEHKQQTRQEKESAEQVEQARESIQDFNTRVGGLVDKHGLDEDTAEIAKVFLGVDNPFNEVDILDGKAVREMVDGGVEKLGKFLTDVRQKAVDEYAAGKSKITPISPTTVHKKPESVEKKELPDDASDEQVFAQAKNEILEMIDDGQFDG